MSRVHQQATEVPKRSFKISQSNASRISQMKSLLPLSFVALATAVSAADRPNVLFVAIDDLRSDLGNELDCNLRPTTAARSEN